MIDTEFWQGIVNIYRNVKKNKSPNQLRIGLLFKYFTLNLCSQYYIDYRTTFSNLVCDLPLTVIV